MTQLLLIQPVRKPAAFGKLNAPFRNPYDGWTTKKHCQAGKFLYWETEMDCIVITPSPARVSFWKDEKTVDGELKMSIHGLPERERGRYTTNDADVMPAPRRKRKRKRQSTRWSKAAIIRNRKRKLRARIEKRFGYTPNDLHLFDADLLARIDAEYKAHLAASPDYYAGKRYNTEID